MFNTNLFKHWTYQLFAPGALLREKYEAFKSLLGQDKRAHDLMAELEEVLHEQQKVDLNRIEKIYDDLSGCVLHIVDDLNRMVPNRYQSLRDYARRLDGYARFLFSPPAFNPNPPHTLPLESVPERSESLVGGKALHLAEIGKTLQLPIPRGFVMTTRAFHAFLRHNDLEGYINSKLEEVDIYDRSLLSRISGDLMGRITESRVPLEVAQAVSEAVGNLRKSAGKVLSLAVRSSAMAEDRRSSFAGQYESLLNVREEEVLDAYKKVLASKYAPRALYYRISYGLSDSETPMAVLVLEMVEASASGVIYTRDLETPESDHLSIHAIWGLGELLVGGEISPDIIRVKRTKPPEILDRRSGIKASEMFSAEDGGTETRPLDERKTASFSLDDASALKLSGWALRLEEHYGKPQDIEWAEDQKGDLFLLQSRPLREEPAFQGPETCDFKDIRARVLIEGGDKACSGIGAGRVFRVDETSDLSKVPEGAVLVARHASPRYVGVLHRVSAVVTDTGSRAGHFASVAREFGVPALVNAHDATERLDQGKEVTVYPEGGVVYEGIVASMVESPCARRNLMEDSPFMRKLRYVVDFVSPLRLVDPENPAFVPGGVRSLHDIIRYSHEMAVREMFRTATGKFRRKGGARRLISKLPMLFYVLDVGGGMRETDPSEKGIRPEDILSLPMKQVLKGLNHPGIQWGDFTHFDWAEYDRIIMSGGIVSADSVMFASYAVVARDYLNLSLKFGYHFVILDSLCSDNADENYILFRFAGGAADMDKKLLRADFLKAILERLGFTVEKKGDLVDAELKGEGRTAMVEHLDLLGRLLGTTRLMDMYLKNSTMVETYVEEFMNGRYHFAGTELT